MTTTPHSGDEAALLARAVRIAATVHEDQKDKSGDAYILHPLRLMFRAETPEAQIIAVLHDVVEDSDYTIEELGDEGFPETVTQAVDLLTRRKESGESYTAFVQRILDGTGDAAVLARRVKLFDLEDNMLMTRLRDELTEKDMERLREYHQAHRKVKAAVLADDAK